MTPLELQAWLITFMNVMQDIKKEPRTYALRNISSLSTVFQTTFGPRAEGTPEREAQDFGDGQYPAGRAARDAENMGQRPLASHGKGGQEGAGP